MFSGSTDRGWSRDCQELQRRPQFRHRWRRQIQPRRGRTLITRDSAEPHQQRPGSRRVGRPTDDFLRRADVRVHFGERRPPPGRPSSARRGAACSSPQRRVDERRHEDPVGALPEEPGRPAAAGEGSFSALGHEGDGPQA